MSGHCFISYSHADGLEFVLKLITELEGGYPSIPTWFEKRDMHSDKDDWDDQIASAIQKCKCLIYVMSQDSTAGHSNCKDEWTWALKYKKPVICLWIDAKAEDQFRLNSRQKIDFITDFGAGLGKLRKAIAHLDSPEGQLEELNHRLNDANRDLRRASDVDKPRVQADIDELKKQIEAQEKVADNPEAAKKQTEQNIQNGLERERKPQLPVASFQSSKFINQPPGFAQPYFQDREVQTELAISFLKDEAKRLLTVVGRGGAGKTAMVCRLLKFVENGGLPDDFERKHGRVEVDGIVYLSEAGSRKVNFANLFEDLCKLLPAASAEKLSALYREPQTSTESKTVQLLAAFHGLKQVIVLLDNFENVVDAEKGQMRDAELDEALRAILHAPHHPVKIIITTRVSARELDTFEPARQRLLPLDTGLPPEAAREAFVLMDEGNLVGIKNAGADLLNLAVTRTLGLPRALEALYAALRTDRFTTLQELLDLPILPEQVVQAYVGEAFNRLDTNAQKVMQALAVYNRPVTPAAVDYLLAPHLPAIDSAPILQRLANMHFARKESGRFYLHPVDREFAFGLLAKGDAISVEQPKTNFFFFKPKRKERDDFTQIGLTDRAASYFAAARKPRAEWKKLEDLSAQLAEFDLRCAAGDYDTACNVLRNFDFDCLLQWGHYHITISMHLLVKDKLKDKYLIMGNMNTLGLAYSDIGHSKEAIPLYEIGLQTAREEKSQSWESAFSNNLGIAYSRLADTHKAIRHFEEALSINRAINSRNQEISNLNGLGNRYLEIGDIQRALGCYEQALSILNEIDDHYRKGVTFINIANYYSKLGNAPSAAEFCNQAMEVFQELGNTEGESYYHEFSGDIFLSSSEFKKALENYIHAIQIADEISFTEIQQNSRWGLTQVYLLQNDFENARITIEAALGYDVPQHNHNVSALHGIIALRQGEEVAARGAFVRAIGQADEILSKTAEYYDALDAKGLALAGLALCEAGKDGGRETVNDGPRSMVYRQQAIEAFQKARQIAPHAGVVKSVLRLFDELAKCEGGEVLQEVRSAVQGG